MAGKIFCIGFHKTGTSSLTNALRILGYRVTGPNGIRDPNIEQNVYSMAYELVDQFDAFQDNPWPIIYKELDKKYPDSKFILTLRDPESWIKSQVRHFGRKKTPMRKWIYGVGCPKGHESIYVARFNHHNQEVLNYFSKRSNDLLIMDLSKGDGWQELCMFLDKEIPNVSFPHANKASDREKRSGTEKLVSKSKNLVNRIIARITKEY